MNEVKALWGGALTLHGRFTFSSLLFVRFPCPSGIVLGVSSSASVVNKYSMTYTPISSGTCGSVSGLPLSTSIVPHLRNPGTDPPVSSLIIQFLQRLARFEYLLTKNIAIELVWVVEKTTKQWEIKVRDNPHPPSKEPVPNIPSGKPGGRVGRSRWCSWSAYVKMQRRPQLRRRWRVHPNGGMMESEVKNCRL